MPTQFVPSIVLAILAVVACGGSPRPRAMVFQLDGMGRTGDAL